MGPELWAAVPTREAGSARRAIENSGRSSGRANCGCRGFCHYPDLPGKAHDGQWEPEFYLDELVEVESSERADRYIARLIPDALAVRGGILRTGHQRVPVRQPRADDILTYLANPMKIKPLADHSAEFAGRLAGS